MLTRKRKTRREGEGQTKVKARRGTGRKRRGGGGSLAAVAAAAAAAAETQLKGEKTRGRLAKRKENVQEHTFGLHVQSVVVISLLLIFFFCLSRWGVSLFQSSVQVRFSLTFQLLSLTHSVSFRQSSSSPVLMSFFHSLVFLLLSHFHSLTFWLSLIRLSM